MMWNMGPDPPYIPHKFRDDTLRPKKVIHEKTQKLTGKKRIIIIIIIKRPLNSYKNKRTSPDMGMS